MIRSAFSMGIGFFIGCVIFGLVAGASIQTCIERGFFGMFCVVMFAVINNKNYIPVKDNKNEKNAS